ncbi:conserved hypothetical protein [Gloeothece citriformis PCC 7424]|uniref:Uncharacterized protein n=1 Tax=Gloeothece citriformis (strain PCC 7424) TaxID=65393 RepID=B7KK75_GLOC7|nr:hypothetical protein [Gloeothece citriformis]ACK70960.1 conserved hypothetical protein [Gloeothece citriformis PCC 7424]
MLKTIPKSLLTWNCDLKDNYYTVGNLEFSLFKKTGKIITPNFEYRIRYKGLLAPKFFLYNSDFRLGYAQQLNSLVRVFNLNYGQNKYQLKPASPLSKKFILQQKKRTIGEIYPKNLLARQAIIDLPTNLPLEFQGFVTWMVLWFWRQGERNLT